MKKLISILLAVLCLVSFCACGQGNAVKFTRGTTSANEYTNVSIGLVFNKPSAWVFYTDAQLAESMGIASDFLKDENLLDSNKVSELIDFMAIDSTTGNNVNLTAARGFSSMSKFVESLKAEMSSVEAITYTFEEETTEVKLGDGTYTRLTAKATIQGINLTQYVYLRKVGTTFISITATDMNNRGSSFFEGLFGAPEAEATN